MKIEKVSYGKTYSLGNYCSERIDLEASIDEDKESCIEAVNQLRHYCDGIHKQNNPKLYQEQETTIPNNQCIKGSITPYDKEGNLLHPLPEKTPEQAAQELIETATPSNIKWFKHLPEKYPQLKQLYQQKLKELQ